MLNVLTSLLCCCKSLVRGMIKTTSRLVKVLTSACLAGAVLLLLLSTWRIKEAFPYSLSKVLQSKSMPLPICSIKKQAITDLILI